MPTVIDELILQLGIDTRKLSAGQRAAISDAKKANEELLKAGSQQEKSAKAIGEAFATAERHALEFFGVVLGARGLKELVSQLTTTDAALGRLGTNLQISPQTLNSWQLLSQRVGGSAEATASSLTRVSEALYNLHRNGQMLPIEFNQLMAASGRMIDPDHGLNKFMTDVASAAHELAKTDVNRAFFLLQGLGIDEGTANAMIKYGGAFTSYLQGVRQYAPTQETIARMQQLQASWVTLQQSATALANTIWSDLEPVLEPMLKQLTQWIDQNREIIGKDFAAGVQRFAEVLKSIDWGGVAANLERIANAILSVLGLPQLHLTPASRMTAIDPTENTFWTHQDEANPSPGTVDLFGQTPRGRDLAKLYGSMPSLIHAAASMYGLNPKDLMKNFRGEGAGGYAGDFGTDARGVKQASSYGPFQLHYGGLNQQFPGSGLGDEFTKETGLDARDPDTIPAQTYWYAKWVSEHGYGASSFMKSQGYGGMMGTPSAAARSSALAGSALSNWARLSTTQQNYPTTTNSSSVEVKEFNIHSHGATADQIVGDAVPALRRRLRGLTAQTGPA